jgi:regulator of protease activity HflC (stomatin/prohibitin superfamily)
MTTRPISIYVLLLLSSLVALVVLHLLLAVSFYNLGLTELLPIFSAIFAIAYGLILGGLTACFLLYLWLRFKPLAVFVTLAASALWIVGLRGYTGANAIVALLSLAAAGAVLALGLYFVSGFILPLSEEGQHAKAYGFLRDYIARANRPGVVIVAAQRQKDKVQERVAGNRLSRMANGPGFVLTGCDHTAAISNGLKFKGVQDPGITFTGFGDQVVHAIDLRPQLRVFPVDAMTRDGIKIRVLASVSFRINAGHRQPEPGQHLPFNKSAAIKAVIRAQRVEHEGKGQTPQRMKQRAWDELPPLIAKRVLQDIISKRAFDGLCAPYQPGGDPPRKTLATEFCAQLAVQLEPLGIQLIEGGISDLEPADPQVYVRRVENWQAEWSRKIMVKEAKGHAARLGILERARAEARAELILSLGRQLEELSVGRAGLSSREVLGQFLTVLEELMMQPGIRPLLPGRTKEALGSMRETLPE